MVKPQTGLKISPNKMGSKLGDFKQKSEKDCFMIKMSIFMYSISMDKF